MVLLDARSNTLEKFKENDKLQVFCTVTCEENKEVFFHFRHVAHPQSRPYLQHRFLFFSVNSFGIVPPTQPRLLELPSLIHLHSVAGSSSEMTPMTNPSGVVPGEAGVSFICSSVLRKERSLMATVSNRFHPAWQENSAHYVCAALKKPKESFGFVTALFFVRPHRH